MFQSERSDSIIVDNIDNSRSEDKALYLITIHCSQKLDYVSQLDLDRVLLWLKMAIPSMHICKGVLEATGFYKQLHYHGIVSVDRYFRYRPYTKHGDSEYTVKTYQIMWKRIHNLSGAINYIQKDLYKQSQQEIIVSNYYLHHYFDQDKQEFIAKR